MLFTFNTSNLFLENLTLLGPPMSYYDLLFLGKPQTFDQGQNRVVRPSVNKF